ncbi:MAG: hypothetical protein K2P57_13325, partial [Burkholderiales bacterium]|nr:hypothetical protein [Burkholderiales bacterium]
MKLKLSIIAAALVAGFAGQAGAAIVTGNTYANNLVLSVWDQTNLTSYTANLGLTMQQVLNGAGYSYVGAPKAQAGAASVNLVDTAANNFSFSDPLLSTYLSTASANTTWSVIAINFGQPSFGATGIFSTSQAPLATVAATTGILMTGMSGANGNYVNPVSIA